MNQLELGIQIKEEGIALKKSGMTQAAKKKPHLLSVAREIARLKAFGGRTITADEVAEIMERRGYWYGDLGNAAGSIFTGGDFEFTGEWVHSQRPSAHSRMIRAWKLKVTLI